MKLYYIGFALGSVGLLAGGAWMARSKPAKPAVAMVYSPAGFGGLAPAEPIAKSKVSPAVEAIEAAYNSGKHAECEAKADALSSHVAQSGEPSLDSLRATQLGAYSAARQKRYAEARDRFQMLRDVASERSDHGKEPGPFWEMRPTYEEEGAFEAVVCTSALGKKQAAETEYCGFMERYPQSSLVHAAIYRISRMHKGDIPKVEEAIWKRAQEQQKQLAERVQREQSFCGPECAAELIHRRWGGKADAHALASEMGTSKEGTSLEALSAALARRGFAARGLMETPAGLSRQPLPALAVIGQGHYVIVDGVTLIGVRIWDPDGAGFHEPAETTVPAAEWAKSWGGVILAVRRDS